MMFMVCVVRQAGELSGALLRLDASGQHSIALPGDDTWSISILITNLETRDSRWQTGKK